MASITLYTRNILETGTVTVTGDADSGFPEARLCDRETALLWKDTVTEAKDFKVDQGVTGNLFVDLLGIFNHNFDGEDIEWQHSDDNSIWVDAVIDWTQDGSGQIIKTLSAAELRRFWKVTLTSMENPQAGELFMSYGCTFDIQARPAPSRQHSDNVRWNRSLGDAERSVKFGKKRRAYNYVLFLSEADLADFDSAMEDLDDYAKPFLICDHAGEYYFCRLTAPPSVSYDNKEYSRVELSIIEKL